MNGDDTRDTAARESTSSSNDETDAESNERSFDGRRVETFRFDHVVRDGDERVTRHVEWSVEHGATGDDGTSDDGTLDDRTPLASDGGVERDDDDRRDDATGPERADRPSDREDAADERSTNAGRASERADDLGDRTGR